MKDLELLEQAAKAIGGEFHSGHLSINKGIDWDEWNPLTDDGDALRLAIKLRISIQFSGSRHSVSATPCFDICCQFASADHAKEIRWQIVRAAASIGKEGE